MGEETINSDLNDPHQMALPMNKIRINEVKNVIQYKINPKKDPGYDFITRKILKELSHKGLEQKHKFIMPYYKPSISLFKGKWDKS
jgi:hypothetical protein